MSDKQPPSDRFEMRLPREFTARVDDWRRTQADLPSRAEAIRRLVGVGLESELKRRP